MEIPTPNSLSLLIRVQATCRKITEHSTAKDIGLMDYLAGRQANGIIFTTMQKFEESDEPLSERRNIIVMADEAHRGQYGLKEKVTEKGEIKIGTARKIRNSLPGATYIGFTGTPIASKDRSTREVFGNYIDVYDMTQAVEDGATRPVYYESRVIKLKLDEKVLRQLDDKYEEFAQLTDDFTIEQSKKDLARMDAVLGAEQTIHSLAVDIIEHYENYRENLLTADRSSQSSSSTSFKELQVTFRRAFTGSSPITSTWGSTLHL